MMKVFKDESKIHYYNCVQGARFKQATFNTIFLKGTTPDGLIFI